MLLAARHGGWWDANKVGLGPPPLLTKDGWLLCYHGVRVTVSGAIYRLGLALLDRDDPTKVLARGNEWVFGPQEPYERSGDVPDVVFPCGWILRDDGDTLHVYYGAADSVVCVAEASLARLLSHLEEHPYRWTKSTRTRWTRLERLRAGPQAWRRSQVPPNPFRAGPGGSDDEMALPDPTPVVSPAADTALGR